MILEPRPSSPPLFTKCLERLFERSPKVFSIVGLWAVKTTKWGLFRHLCAHSLEPKLGAILNFQTVSRREILRTSP